MASRRVTLRPFLLAGLSKECHRVFCKEWPGEYVGSERAVRWPLTQTHALSAWAVLHLPRGTTTVADARGRLARVYMPREYGPCSGVVAVRRCRADALALTESIDTAERVTEGGTADWRFEVAQLQVYGGPDDGWPYLVHVEVKDANAAYLCVVHLDHPALHRHSVVRENTRHRALRRFDDLCGEPYDRELEC